MATSDAVLRMDLSFLFSLLILIDSNFITGPHVRHELRAFPMIPQVHRNVIQLQEAASAGKLSMISISNRQKSLRDGLPYGMAFKFSFNSTNC